MGDWAVADCEEVRTPWLALSGPRAVFILNERTTFRLPLLIVSSLPDVELMGLTW